MNAHANDAAPAGVASLVNLVPLQRRAEPSSGLPGGIANFDEFLAAFRSEPGFTFLKVGHGFWESVAAARRQFGNPVPEARWAEADQALKRRYFFETGFAPALIELLTEAAAERDPELHLSGDGLLLKRAVTDGRFGELADLLADRDVLLVGPGHIEPLRRLRGLEHVEFMPIHEAAARAHRDDVEGQIADWLAEHPHSGTTVLLQAGTLAPYLVLKLRRQFGHVRWIDGGLALSIGDPEDIIKRPWGRTNRRQILAAHWALGGTSQLPISDHTSAHGSGMRS